MKNTYTNEEFKKAVEESLSLADVMRKLGLKVGGANYATVNRKIKSLGLDTSHFTGQGWNVGNRYRQIKPAQPLKEILVKDSTYVSTSKLKIRLLKEGLKEYKCEMCGNTEWQGNPIPLELHHINGDHSDLRIENLQILCPNCHAFTDNYRGKVLSARKETSDVESPRVGEGVTEPVILNPEPSSSNEQACVETRQEKPKSSKRILEPKYCAYCGKELIGKARRNKCCSQECAHKLNGSKRPSVTDLLNAFKEFKNYTQVGKHYNVSDNAVRKWVKLYQIEDMVKG